ncbi:hypothetical protein DPSP01_007915 [Paraphaeosphaeria sporulosa]|uniref:YCII-related domain-containing protein n=1 Tax=Paraphaeosphaeria sporulosa TaxID=1460663 RepID=A0A177CIC0_9PLEO|nr:uncharacterized protein CC84DRAFT_1163478 [Paraphaeosphaeria sporulosa]OAG07264.1 hypothetical protein CC84DRAFT_1163478 [Paraphaeosphaeria sporulosa]
MPPPSLLRLCTRLPTSVATPRRPLTCTRFAPRPTNTRPRFGLSRTMASSAAPLQEWLVIAPDFEGALEKRLAVRGEHLAGLKKDDESFWLWGGAMLEEPITEGQAPKMKGSAMLIGASSREEVVERLKKDVYVKGEVWDWSKVQIIPFKSALRKAL